MITYLTQLTICWTILFLVYFLFLKRETFFAYNRWFLLSGLALGLLIPLIDWTTLITHEAESIGHIYVAPVQTQVHQLDIYVATADHIPLWYLILTGLYTIGVFVAGIKLFNGIREIWSLRRHAHISKEYGYELILTDQIHMPFSFMNAVYWSRELYLESNEKDRILAHEVKHVSALHSLDILFIEILSVLFWFHPMVYIYRKEIKEVHEYEADAAACVIGSKKAYGQLLLNQANSGLQLALANHFFYSQLKNRFKMMTRKPSTRTAKLKYLIAIPIIGLAALVFSFVNKEMAIADPAIVMTDTLMPPPPPPPPVPNIGDVVFLDHKQYKIELTDVLFVNGERIGLVTDELIKKYSDEGPWILKMYKGDEARNKFGKDISTGVYSINKYEEKSTLWVGQPFAMPSGQVMVIEPTDILMLNGQNKGFATQGNLDNYVGNQKWNFKIYKGQEAKDKYGISEGTGVLDVELRKPSSRSSFLDEDLKEDIRKNGEIFRVVEQMPRFPGCEDLDGTNADLKQCADKKMLEFLYKNITYPAEARAMHVSGNVVLKFIVEKDGSITHPAIMRDPGAGLGEEALRIVELMGNQAQKWTPGYQKGQAVRVQFILPVKFQLKSEQKEQTNLPIVYNIRNQFDQMAGKVLLIIDDKTIGEIEAKDLSNYIEVGQIFRISIKKNKDSDIGEHISKFDIKTKSWAKANPDQAKEIKPHGTIVGKTVAGQVINPGGFPVAGVNVIIKGTQRGTATDLNGEYYLPGVNDDDVLVFIYKDSKPQEINVSSKNWTNVLLQLPPVVVGEVYTGDLVDARPRFPGCEDLNGSVQSKTKCAEKEFLTYLYKNIRYPGLARNNDIQGQVVATFVVKKDGTVDYVHIIKDIGAGLGEEVELLLKNMNSQGKWTPAMKDGKPINFEMTLPVIFKLKGEDITTEIKKDNLDKAVNPLAEIVVVALSDKASKTKKTEKEVKQNSARNSLDEVVVVGYGKTSSKVEVKVSKTEGKNTKSENSLSEVTVVGYSDKNKTINAHEKPALIVLDGYIVGRADGSRNLKYVDPKNIESISVLKGEKAIEEYGDQGKYGVILITTKEPVLKQTNAKLKLSSFNLYPNPASNELTVEFEGPSGDYVIEVIDGKGATQLIKELHNQDHAQTIMNISDLNTGIYYLRIISDQKATAKAFVKK